MPACPAQPVVRRAAPRLQPGPQAGSLGRGGSISSSFKRSRNLDFYLKPDFKVWQLTRLFPVLCGPNSKTRPPAGPAGSRPPRLPLRGSRRVAPKASAPGPATSAGCENGSGHQHGHSGCVCDTGRVAGTGHTPKPPRPANPTRRPRPRGRLPRLPQPPAAELGSALPARGPHCVPDGAAVCRPTALAHPGTSNRVDARMQCLTFGRAPGSTTGRQRHM